MKKRILSCLMALALCLTLLPTAALAEETEGTAQTPPAVEESTDPANGEVKQENQPVEAKQENQPAEQEEQQEDPTVKQDEAVADVQAMIDALPDAAELDGMDDTAQESACLAASEAYDALTAEQQSALTGTEKMFAILEWATRKVELLAEDGDVSKHTDHNGWTAINSANALTDIDKAGNYYLTENVTLTGTWTPEDGVVLCLNGKTITGADGQEAIQVNRGVTFTLTDCHTGNEVGQITHKTDASGCGVYVQYGTFNMYGGSITGNTVGGSGGGVCATNSSTFNMYGGSITGNSAKSQGGGVYAASTFNMYGGTISDNSASQGGGVFVSTQYFTVSGNAKITDNTNNGASEKNNVYLNYSGTSIQIGTEGLQSGAKIGVTTYATPSNSAPVTIVSSDAKAGYEEYFTSDKEGCYPVYQGGKIVLYAGAPHKHPICGETCADGEHTQNITWTPIETEGELKAASANGYYYLTKDVTLTSTWTPADGVKLCLNGHTITTTANVDAIEVGQNVTFTLTNCKGTGKITHQYKDQDRVYTAKGCGAYVNGGTFHLYGGTFSRNIGHIIGKNSNGGGVYVENSGTFYMYGGSIIGNSAGNTNDNTDGGGVYLNGSTFHMSGGSIIGNSSGSCGGVYVDTYSTFTLSGSASITGNWTNGSGGGVYVRSYSKFEMHDNASITGNSAKSQGGGVHVGWIGQFSMYGGSITGNNVKNNSGGGVNLASGTVTVSGSANITGNVKGGKNSNGIYTGGTANNVGLNVDSSITIGDGLTGTARIGVANEPTESNPVKIATGATGNLDYATIFIPDAADQGYVVNTDGSGNLFLNAHRHSWTYALKEGTTDTIIAACDAEGCANKDGGSVTISASDAAYDRSAKAATVTASDGWKGDAADSIAVKYTGRNGTAYDSTSAPTNAGKYTASITLGDATASVEYTIAKADPQASDFTFTAPSGLTYDGHAKSATVAAKTGINGMGNITVKYFKDGTEVTEAKDAGDYTVKANVTEGDNYNAASDLTDSGWTFSIGKGDQTITVPTGKTIVKNGIAVDISDWASVTGVENGTAPGALSYALNDTSLTGVTLDENNKLIVKSTSSATTVTIKVTAAATDNYNKAEKTFDVTVVDKTRATVTISGMPATLTYGDTFVLTITQTDDSSAVPANWTKFNHDKHLKYLKEESHPEEGKFKFQAIGFCNGYGCSGKFTVEFESETHKGSLTVDTPKINKKTLTKDDLHFGGLATDFTKVYDGSTSFTKASVEINSSAKVNPGDTLPEVKGSYAYNSANVKEASKVTFTSEKTESANYILPAGLTVEHDATITEAKQAALTVTSTAATYGTDLTLTTDGGSGTGAVTYTVTNGTGEATIVGGSKLHPTKAGTVSVTATKSGGDNYEDVTSAEKKITIGQADYNGTASKTVNIVKGRSTVQTGTLTAADFFPEGQMPDGAKITAWSLTSHPTAILSAVSVGGGKLSYLSAKNIATASEESGSVTIATTNYKDITATLTFHPTDKLVQDGFKFENGSVTKTYGDEDFTLTTTGKVEGSTVTYESSKPAVATVDGTGKVTILKAGSTVITATAAETADYEQATATCTLTVEKKPITIPAADATAFTYNGTEQTYALAEDGAYTITGNKQTNANETGYSVTAALKDTTNTKWADGTTADKTYTFVIGKAVITVKAKDQTAYVGDKTPVLGADSYTVSGLVGEEKLTTQPTVKYVGADGSEIAPDMTKTGEVKILAGGAAASGNYTIRYEDGKLTVSTRPSSGGGSSRPSTHPVKAEVSKDPDGTVSLSKTSAAKGDKVTITVKPERHYEVGEVIVRNSKGKQLAVKDNGDGTFTFEMPADKVTVEPTFSWVNPFADVANSAYYVDAVEWMLKREVTQGTTETTFSPNLNCTRAQIVTFLWRAAGSPAPKGTVSFADVPAGSYYAKAVAWAVENGITGGTGDGLFSPDAACTRAQSAAFLYRAAGSPAVSGSAGFSDVAADAYYAQAVAWAKEHGITDGIGGGLFGSANDCTRAQIAAFLWRLYAEK